MDRAARATRNHRIVLALLPLFLLVSFIVTKRSISSYRHEQANRELMKNVEEALRLEGKFQADEKQAIFLNEPVSPLAQAFLDPSVGQETTVLGEEHQGTTDEKWIDIDLSTQTLRAMEGEREVYKFLISSGKWAPTPTGEFRIWSKFKYTKMSGGSKELNTYYYLPNVPYVMYFHNGYGIHGAYWHNNFGYPMSHGCVNMAPAEAEKIFYWSSPQLPEGVSMMRSSDKNLGTRVVVHGETPKN